MTQQNAQEIAAQIISFCKNTAVPSELNSFKDVSEDEFKSFDRISIWSEQIDFPEIKSGKDSKYMVGVALAKTSNRFDRYDHDD